MRERLDALTGVRFCAALWVLLGHYQTLVPYPPQLLQLIAHDREAVSLFFVLSGFILYYTYGERFLDTVRRQDAVDFWRARFARVYPMHLVAHLLITPIIIAFMLFLPQGLFPESRVGLSLLMAVASWLGNAMLLQALVPLPAFGLLWNSPSWSISAEAFFYALFPFFVVRVLGQARSSRQLGALLLALLLLECISFSVSYFAVFVIATPLKWWYTTGLVYTLPIDRVWEFFIGCCVGAMYLRLKTHGGLLVRSVWAREVAVLSSLTALLMVLLLTPATGVWDTIPFVFAWYVPCTPCFALLLLALASGPSLLTRLLSVRAVVLLGEASYAQYIVQGVWWLPLMYLQQAGVTVPGAVAATAMLATLPISLACYRWVESPARRWLRRDGGRPVSSPPEQQVAVPLSLGRP